MTIRKKPFFIFIGLFFIEVYIALYVKDTFIRPYLGDVLVVFLVHSFVRIFSDKWQFSLPLYVFLFAFAVECLQLFNISQNKVIRIIIGTTFDWKDVACYAIGALILLLGKLMIRRKV